MAEKALTAVIQEACIHWVSTRSVDDPVKALGMTGVSRSQVSRLCEEIDERVDAFLSRSIEGGLALSLEGLSGISCAGGHNGKEGDPACHDANHP